MYCHVWTAAQQHYLCKCAFNVDCAERLFVFIKISVKLWRDFFIHDYKLATFPTSLFPASFLQCVVVDELRRLVLHVVEAHFHVTILFWMKRRQFSHVCFEFDAANERNNECCEISDAWKVFFMHTTNMARFIYIGVWPALTFSIFIYKNYYIQSYKFPFRRVVSTKDVIPPTIKK